MMININIEEYTTIEVLDLIITQPKQFKIALLSVFTLCVSVEYEQGKKHIFTGDIYEIYKEVSVLWQRC